jgi:DNA-binding HxlR family transcriptional regulator
MDIWDQEGEKFLYSLPNHSKQHMSQRKTTSTNFLNQSFLETKCALNELIYLLSKRWTTEVLFSIEEGNNRFSSIKDDLKFISDHILADRLRLLEQNKFIHKKVFHDIQPRAEYSLTETGLELSEHLGQLCTFAETIELQSTIDKKEPVQNLQ